MFLALSAQAVIAQPVEDYSGTYLCTETAKAALAFDYESDVVLGRGVEPTGTYIVQLDYRGPTQGRVSGSASWEAYQISVRDGAQPAPVQCLDTMTGQSLAYAYEGQPPDWDCTFTGNDAWTDLLFQGFTGTGRFTVIQTGGLLIGIGDEYGRPEMAYGTCERLD